MIYGSFVYAKYTVVERRQLLITLDSFGGSIREPWFVVGDFNAIVSEVERLGCQSSRVLATEFNNFILGAGLMDVKHNGNKYTWVRKEHGLDTKWARLD